MTESHRTMESLFAEARSLTMSPDDVAKAVTVVMVPRWRSLRMLVIALTLVFATTATAYYVSQKTAQQLAISAIGCAATTEGHGDGAVLIPDGTEPTTACAAQWADGAIDRTTTHVPPLTACADMARSAVVVFPSSDPAVCERNALSQMPADFSYAVRATASLQRFLANSGCLTADQAATRARTELDAAGLTDWKVTTRMARNPQECVQISSDPEHTMLVVQELPRSDDAPAPADKAWATLYATVLGSAPQATGFCPDPQATIAQVRAAIRTGALADSAIYIGRTGLNDVMLESGFTSTLRCADISMDTATGAITIQPEVPRHTAYPSVATVRSEMPGEMYGLRFEPTN